MSHVHVVQSGETLVAIAERYGFRAWQTIAESPENELLIRRRGNPHALRAGDELHIPAGQIGECLVRAGADRRERAVGDGALSAPAHHRVVVKTHRPLLEIRAFTEFRRVPEGIAAGAKNGTIQGWIRGTTHLTVKNATISIAPGTARVGATDKAGIVRVDALSDGTWTLRLDPDPDQLSAGPALPDDDRDHGLDWNEGNVERARSTRPSLEIEYRPLDLEIDVLAGVINDVRITSGKRDDRPHHAVCFWRDGVASGPKGVDQVLEIDLKPDFMRRLDKDGGVHPITRKRSAAPRLFQIHHTTGNLISGVFPQFFNTSSGIHFVNDRDGHVLRMADDRYQVRHGGGEGGAVTNAWNDRTNINDQAIGVENVQGGDKEFTAPQVDALIGLVRRARELYTGIEMNHVIGHCDVFTGKLECPGPLFPWQQLEEAGVACPPLAISDEQMETEWGGFFAGSKGNKRTLKQGDADRPEGDGTFSVIRKGRAIASALTLGPVALLGGCLHRIGYTPNRSGRAVMRFEEWRGRHGHEFGAGTRVALRFFKAHYCTESRPSASKHAVLDHSLAKLVLGCFRSLTA